jgi:hypothetical protein
MPDQACYAQKQSSDLVVDDGEAIDGQVIYSTKPRAYYGDQTKRMWSVLEIYEGRELRF